MKAKLVRESISDLLAPKKEEDIKNVLEKFSKSFYEMYQYIKEKYGVKRIISIGVYGYEIKFSIRSYDFEVIITRQQKTIYARNSDQDSVMWEDWVQVNDVEDLEKYIRKTVPSLDESVFKPKDLNTVFQDKVYDLEQTNEYLRDVYNLVNSNVTAFRPLTVSEFINDNVILKIITKAFYSGQNPNKPANEIKKYLLDKGYYLGKNVVTESKIFKPKSSEEIRKNLEKEFPIADEDEEDATGHLTAAIYRKNLEYVKYSLEKGGKPLALNNNHNSEIFQFFSRGNLWLAFNENSSDEILIELLKHPKLVELYSTNEDFRFEVLRKAIYMGNVGVVDWLLKKPENTYDGVYEALVEANEWGKGFEGFDEAESLVLKWLQEHKPPQKPMRESVGDILKPKSEEEIIKSMENMDVFDYKSLLIDLTYNNRFYSAEKYVADVFNYLPGVEKAFNDKISPLKFFNSTLEEYYNNYWEPDGSMQLTNTGGIEIKLIDSEYVEYRFTGEIIPKIAEIEYADLPDEELEYEGDEIEDEDRSYFADENGNKWFLDQFMKI